MEEPSRAGRDALEGVELRAGTSLAAGVAADRIFAGEPAKRLDAFGEHFGVPLIRQEAVVDRKRRAGVG